MINIEKARQISGPIYWEEIDWLAKQARNAMVAIELGSLGGKSSRAIADNLPPDGVLYCIDTWAGSKEAPGELEYAAIEDGNHCYIDFLNSVWDLIQAGKIIPLRMHGKYAAQFLEKNLIKAELIFIDAGHAKGETKEDINNYLPLLKPNGILCGHDYNSPEGTWPDVAKEVHEVFGSKVQHPPNTTIWYIES